MEFIERTTRRGQFRSVLVDPDLKAAGSSCTVYQNDPAWDGSIQYTRKTSNGAGPGTRYATFNSLEEAYAESIKWAKRRIALHKRDQRIALALVIARFVRALGNPAADGDGYIRNPNRRF